MKEFRGKRLDNGEWVYGYCIENSKYSFIVPKEWLDDDKRTSIYDLLNPPASIDVCCWEVIPSSVGRSTGLLDKNGKKKKDVYAGDKIIVTDGDYEAIGVVEMNGKTGQWVWKATELETCLTVYIGKEIPLWEVLDKQNRWKGCLIGTIHDEEAQSNA